jgi:hypothetical protein
VRKTREHVYAIVRVDQFHDSAVPLENMITIKEIVWSIEQAEAEVSRLNELNGSKGCKYFWQTTRLIGNEQAEMKKSDQPDENRHQKEIDSH